MKGFVRGENAYRCVVVSLCYTVGMLKEVLHALMAGFVGVYRGMMVTLENTVPCTLRPSSLRFQRERTWRCPLKVRSEVLLMVLELGPVTPVV